MINIWQQQMQSNYEFLCMEKLQNCKIGMFKNIGSLQMKQRSILNENFHIRSLLENNEFCHRH